MLMCHEAHRLCPCTKNERSPSLKGLVFVQRDLEADLTWELTVRVSQSLGSESLSLLCSAFIL